MAKASRFAFIDLLRALAAQLIVLHHLAFYGPLSDFAMGMAGGLMDWLYEYGRLAVQVFFVTGGYCLAGTIERRAPGDFRSFIRSLTDRYFRIGLPYLVALGAAVIANEVARLFMQHPSISDPPSPGQVVAHIFFLHNILGFEALTAGIWYLAIDIQLFALVAAVFAITTFLSAGKGHAIARWTLLALGIFSAFMWNTNAELEHFAIYFLGSYVLGMVVAWTRAGSLPKPVLFLYLLAIIGSLHVHYRIRLAVALAVAVLLVASHGRETLSRIASHRWVQPFAAITYSLFLIHFPICLVVNAVWSRYLPPTPGLSLLGMGVAWALSTVSAFWFHRHVELRLARIRLAPESTRVANRMVLTPQSER